MLAEDFLLEFISVMVAMGALGAVIIAANIADRDNNQQIKRILQIVLFIINGLIVVLYGAMQVVQAYQPSTDTTDPLDKSAAWGAFVISLLVGGLATALLSRSFRQRLAWFFPRQSPTTPIIAASSSTGTATEPRLPFQTGELLPKRGRPLFPQMLNYYTEDDTSPLHSHLYAFDIPVQDTPVNPPKGQSSVIRGFNPDSMVHTLALVFVLYMLGVQFIDFVLAGGLTGVAENLEGSVNGWSLLINMLPFVVLPILGIGFPLRRTLRESANRLGLGLPNLEGLAVAIGITILLFVFVAIVSTIWMGLVSEETFQEQTEASDALAEGITTLGLAFLLAMVAAVGEEVAFRGALQPVFGLWPTALIFALTHAQYTLTPAWLIIFGVAIGFGWIRQRYNTTVSMITHFTYNFIPLALTIYAPEQTAALLHWLF